MNLNRRQFLQAMSATFAAIALPMPGTRLAPIEIDEAIADVPISADNPLGVLTIDGVDIPVISVSLDISQEKIETYGSLYVKTFRPGDTTCTLSFSTFSMDVQSLALSDKYHDVVFRPKFSHYTYMMKAKMCGMSVSCKSNDWIVCDCEMYVDKDWLTRTDK